MQLKLGQREGISSPFAQDTAVFAEYRKAKDFINQHTLEWMPCTYTVYMHKPCYHSVTVVPLLWEPHKFFISQLCYTVTELTDEEFVNYPVTTRLGS